MIEDIVNLVGINLNTASIYLLQNISGLYWNSSFNELNGIFEGINKATAKKIYANRPYSRREDLEKVISKKIY